MSDIILLAASVAGLTGVTVIGGLGMVRGPYALAMQIALGGLSLYAAFGAAWRLGQ